MNRSDTEQNSASRAIDANSANTRLTGSRLIIARVLWLALVVPGLVIYLASLPAFDQQLQRGCVDLATCSLNGDLTAQGLQALSTIGISASEYATLLTIFFAIIAAIWCGVGFLIFWRRSDDWLALLAAFFLVMSYTTSSSNPPNALALAYPALTLPLSISGFLGQASIGVFFLFFPNGRLMPRWMGLILLLAIINAFLNNFPSFTSSFETNWPGWLYLPITGVIFVALIFSQIYRYRRVSTPVQRQQTKWIVFGVTAAVGVYLGLIIITVIAGLIPSLFNLLNNNLFNEVWGIILPIALLLIPLSIGFSILRYRLYDIDLLINRTLVYGTLTVLLALVYVGLIFGLQYLLRGIISQNNDVAIVVSTLTIAALFQPLRRRIQAIIDRRFYRRKYDAAKIVESFSATLRNEVDLNQLSEHLIAVVQDTMQPAHVSLWLRKSEQERKPDTQRKTLTS